MSTYQRKLQLGASRRRREDALILQAQKRWNGASYLGGDAVECSLKALLCYNECLDDFQDTSLFKAGFSGASLHNLVGYLDSVPRFKKAIQLDTTNTYRNAWNCITSHWRTNELRYSDRQGDVQVTRIFLEAVHNIYGLIMRQQGEAP